MTKIERRWMWTLAVGGLLCWVILWPALAGPVGVYAIVSVCSPDLLLCVTDPAKRFDTWKDCDDYVEKCHRGSGPDRVTMGHCRSWSPARDWRKYDLYLDRPDEKI